jgi:hypothetical protein
VGFLDGILLADLNPQWMHQEGMRVDVGLAFDCPRCKQIPKGHQHRLTLWFVSHEGRNSDLTLGKGLLRLFDFAGTRWREITVWSEWPPPRDPLLQLEHWWGYIENGTVYDALRLPSL